MLGLLHVGIASAAFAALTIGLGGRLSSSSLGVFGYDGESGTARSTS